MGAGLAVAGYNESLFHAQAGREAQVQADILAASLTAALAFDDAAVEQQYLGAFAANPEVEAAGLYGASGNLLSGYRRDPSQAVPARAPAQAPAAGDGQIVVTAPVVQAETRLGSVYLRIQAEQARQHQLDLLLHALDQAVDGPAVEQGAAVVGDIGVPQKLGGQAHLLVLALDPAGLDPSAEDVADGVHGQAEARTVAELAAETRRPRQADGGLQQGQLGAVEAVAGLEDGEQRVLDIGVGLGGLAHRLDLTLEVLGHDDVEQVGLVDEAGEHRAGGQTRLGGDVADGGGLVAALHEQLAGRVQHPAAGLQLGLSAQGGGDVRFRRKLRNNDHYWGPFDG
ncbi:MAG: CHASE sensor domain-containing protein [Caulobacteraceae bacterium]